ncbi:MAG TPA: uroporphyrinogen decarboxylase family protein [Spirochaetia bacterium]|nr:uroporphyrinogen decarboxylase family protein [Spirochaetia bacterium]
MTSKERLLTALAGGMPDRVPATIHQWQDYHLETFMGGASDLEAFKDVGLDAAITRYPFVTPRTDTWRVRETHPAPNRRRFEIETPGGALSWESESNEYTSWVSEHLLKRDEDVELLAAWHPRIGLDREQLRRDYDAVGDAGILRMFLIGYQGGCWQDACELYGTEALIMATFDKPAWVHRLLGVLLEQKLAFIHDHLRGAAVDLVETGGGAASSTVISPQLHEEFCLPYDRKLHDALHEAGHRVVYHTCGGMKAIVPQILKNGCDASETLSPPGIGGDISPEDRAAVKESLGGRLALIGGLDQNNVLGRGSAAQIAAEVRHLFSTFGRGGGYVMSASDHFFHVPKENLVHYARASRECTY